MFPGGTGDPVAFTEIVTVLREKFGLAKMVMAGDRRMITSAWIAALNQQDDGTARSDPYGWITALRAPAIGKLMAEDGPLQLSLFDQQDPAEITSPDFPKRAAHLLPQPGANRRPRPQAGGPAASHREAAGPLIARVAAGRLAGAAQIGAEAGKVISKYQTAKHFEITITDTSLTVTRRQEQIDAEAALDGFYVLRTPVPVGDLDAPAVVSAYKNLKNVERDFRYIKADDLDLRPVSHRLEERVKAHVLICMLTCYLTWHLRRACAPLTFTDEHPPPQDNPVAPARRSAAARPRPPARTTQPVPCRSFRGLIEHLATSTRNQVQFTSALSHGSIQKRAPGTGCSYGHHLPGQGTEITWDRPVTDNRRLGVRPRWHPVDKRVFGVLRESLG